MSFKMKVGHISTVHRRGDARILLKECKSLADSYEVHFIVADGWGDELFNGVQIHDIGRPTGRFSRFAKSGFQAANAAIKLELDLVHFHDSELMLAALYLKMRGIKVVYDVHEDLPRDLLIKEWIPGYLRRIVSWSAAVAEAVVDKIFDGIAAATPTIGARFSADKTIVVRNFPLIEEFSAIETGTANPRCSSCVAYVGTLAEARGVLEAIEAADQAGATLILAGGFNTADLEARARRLPGWGKVDYRGVVARHEVARIYSESRIGLCTLLPTQSHFDAYPVKLFEYMAAGLPVVASDFPLWRDLIGNYDCAIFVDPLAPDQIADAIRQLLVDPVRGIEMGANGRKAVHSVFNWSAEAGKLLDLYKRIEVSIPPRRMAGRSMQLGRRD